MSIFATVVLIVLTMTVFVVLVLIGYFDNVKDTRNKIKENINQPDKLEDVLNILNNSEKKGLHNFIITQLAKINDSERINIICQQCFNQRNPLLVKLIVKKQWIASEPAQLKIYTILTTNQLNLIKNSDGEEIKYLLDSLKDKDIEIVNRAKQSLEEIRIINQHGIDYLCQEWLLKERDKFLESIIVKHKYQAVSPLRVKILTALKTEKLELLLNLNSQEKIILINTFDDSDQVIVNNARKMGEFLLESSCKSLMYFITEQWNKYEQIDFDQNILKNIFHDADSILRKKITEKIKISGRSDWLQVIFAERKRKNIELMTDYDWQVIVELLSKTDDEKEKWKLAQQAPPFYSQQLLKQIHSLDFIKGEKFSQKNVLQLGKKVIANSSDLSTCINETYSSITITDHSSFITALAMNRESTLLASGSGDKTIKLWELPSRQLLYTLIGHTGEITSLVINREGTLLVSGSGDKTMKLWELPSGRLLHTLTGHNDWINTLIMNREGTLLASASGDNTIKLWELPSGRLLNTLTGHTAWVKSLVMNRKGTLLVSGGGDKTMKLWELPSGRLLHTLTGHNDWINTLIMNREGTLLASASGDKTIKLWELPSGRLLHTLTGHTDEITSSLAMNGEGTLLAFGSGDNTIKLWELPSGRLLHTLTGHTRSIYSLVMNREGTLLGSGSMDKTIKLWKLYSLDRLPVSKIINHYAYIQDNLKRDDLTENQRNWFEFMLALVNNYRRFEIDIEDAPIIAEAGEFDIEIEE